MAEFFKQGHMIQHPTKFTQSECPHLTQPRHLLTHRLRRGCDRVFYKLGQAGGRLPGVHTGRAVCINYDRLVAVCLGWAQGGRFWMWGWRRGRVGPCRPLVSVDVRHAFEAHRFVPTTPLSPLRAASLRLPRPPSSNPRDLEHDKLGKGPGL